MTMDNSRSHGNLLPPNADHPTTAALGESAFVRRRGVLWFLLIAFGGAWLPWLVVYAAGGSMDNVLIQLATAAFVPAIAACVVRRWVTRQGFVNSGLGLDVRRYWPYLVTAVTIPWGVLLVAVGAAVVAGWSPSDADVSGSSWAYLAVGPLICIASAPIFWGEEYGWTAYLRDRLVPGRPITTTFLTGTIWGVWHWPLPWIGYFGGHVQVDAAVVAMLLWVPLSILLEFVIGWLWSQTGSVWPGAMLHAGCNLVASQGLYLVLGDSFGPDATTLLLCVGLTPFVVAIVATGHTAGGREPARVDGGNGRSDQVDL
ncbi:CPBP family intramembrane glutamic endopeptidase [Rhodococcus sp. CH91]|uniref:CPBP family intramembrane glutamic endopeptidase n=1 Tax=Rhodococcus sp. CH91 TaxID=2910256 RepID=UPI001F4BB230|nr:CPBP family intramembrane glutamic endopeptidase [Rhodococcus sp. CH91]